MVINDQPAKSNSSVIQIEKNTDEKMKVLSKIFVSVFHD
ncbi:hypothetical protein QE422_001894 [Chryseobacterium sp. SORGH_AS 447]|nr:hypothetical protein [Chryseobacterium sp. SORGH_AS_0447]